MGGMIMKRVVCMCMSCLIALSLTGCGGQKTSSGNAEASSGASGGAEPVVLKMATTNSTAMWEDTELDLMAAEKYFIQELPKRTGGRYEVKIFLDGQLASGTKEQVQGIKSGAFDITEMGTGSVGEFTQAFMELNVPYLFKNQDVVDEVLLGEVGQDMLARSADDIGNVKPLFYADNGFRMLTHASKVIKTPADLKGVKIRVQPDPVMIATFEALGASVVSVPYSELFTALQQKLVDAQENPATNLYNAKLYEVQKTCTVTNHMFTAFVYYMNADTFNGMSVEDQKAVMELSAECQKIRADKMKEVTEKYIEKLKEAGLEFYELSNEELQVFSDCMVNGVWPQCTQEMGQERWDKLQNAVEEAEKKLNIQ